MICLQITTSVIIQAIFIVIYVRGQRLEKSSSDTSQVDAYTYLLRVLYCLIRSENEKSICNKMSIFCIVNNNKSPRCSMYFPNLIFTMIGNSMVYFVIIGARHLSICIFYSECKQVKPDSMCISLADGMDFKFKNG